MIRRKHAQTCLKGEDLAYFRLGDQPLRALIVTVLEVSHLASIDNQPSDTFISVKVLIARFTRLLCVVFVVFFSQRGYCRSRPHYRFILPDGYIGWIQVVFNDPDALSLYWKKNAYQIEVPESGIPRTSDARVNDVKAKDEFLYKIVRPNGRTELVPIPGDYTIRNFNHGGFGIMDTGGKGKGSSWFIFIGSPEMRSKVPLADWDKVVEDYEKTHPRGQHVIAPEIYPVPGRMKSLTPL